MGFFERLLRLILRPNYEEKDNRLSSRIDELRHKSQTAVRELTKTKNESHNSNLSWYKIEVKEINIKIAEFTPKKILISNSMSKLRSEREAAEKRRLEELHQKVENVLDLVSRFIERENAAKANSLLSSCLNSLNELNEETLWIRYRSAQQSLSELNETLRQREVERRRLEEQKRQEQDRKRSEEERIRKEAEEREKQERLRRQQEYEERLQQEQQKTQVEIDRLKDQVSRKKDDSDRILDYLKTKGVSYFYHFTDESNLSSIRRYGGLFSWEYCVNHDIHIPNAGGDGQSRDLDCRHRLQDYVRLSFCTDHPMAYVVNKRTGGQLVLLKIKIDVATFLDTQFSNINAADNNVSHGASFADLRAVNIEATKERYVNRQSPIFAEHQAECMVKTFLPIEYIVNISNPQRLYF